MNWRTSINKIIQHCSEGGFCECCELYDEKKKDCVFKESPSLWEAEKIRRACIDAGLCEEVNDE